MSPRTSPPFRADHVGSLLRTAPLKDARTKRAKGEIDAAALEAVEDREIEKIVRKQEEVGLKLATDGEFRRSWWHFDFFWGLKGVEKISAPPIKFHGVETKSEALKITGKINFAGHPQLEHFKFLKSICKVTPKMTIPAPSTFHFRQGRAMISKDVYPGYDEFFVDVAAAYRKAIRAFYDAGCRYLQLDDTAWAMICDPKEREGSKARGDDPGSLPAIYARVTNEALKDKPADMAITMHSCRGNFRSTFIASGGYDFVAEQLLAHTNLDGYFLEYDTDRAGGFEPLRYFPKGKKQLVLGLVTSKSGRLEKKDDI
ncbi:MAG TPA: 5-methyltetrahydropteroyltriglutamate--homocysteine S-methyltransferase, partial [Pseudolabrys sp.]|nr:5-methyltetrahydropteroyltriglutamate--homocysteine S-methyltransferase [Pseudolabrys sp.]